MAWTPTPEQRARLDALALGPKCAFAVSMCRIVDDDAQLGELLAKLFGDRSKVKAAIELARCGVGDIGLQRAFEALFFDDRPVRVSLPTPGSIHLDQACWPTERN